MRLTGASCREAWERTTREAWRSGAKFGRSSFWISSQGSSGKTEGGTYVYSSVRRARGVGGWVSSRVVVPSTARTEV